MTSRTSPVGHALAWLLLFTLLGTERCALGQRASAGADDDSFKRLREGSEAEILETDDGVFLGINYWSPAEAGKNTPVVVLLHMRGKSQLDWFPLAKQLSEDGLAVVTFDFRGHGESRRVNPDIYKDPRTAERVERERQERIAAGLRVVEPGTRQLSRAEREGRAGAKPKVVDSIDQANEFKSGKDLARYLANDVRAVKRFLIEQNNAARLNLRRLGLVAAGEGCSVAMVWIDEFELKSPGKLGHHRQGGDLGALVLVSPIWNYSGMKAPVSFDEDDSRLPILIISGAKGKSATDAGKFAKLMRIPDSTQGKSIGKPRSDSLWMKVDSTLTGTDLVQASELKLDAAIRGFLKGRLTADIRLGWEKRTVDVDLGGFGAGRAE